MKLINFLCIFCFAIILSSCSPYNNLSPTQVETDTTVTSTSTILLNEPVLVSTLEPEQASKEIQLLFQGTKDCEIPCFLGIYPEQTTLLEAQEILNHYGLQLKYTNTSDNKDFFQIDFKSSYNKLSFVIILAVESGKVINLRLNIYPEEQEEGIQRTWHAFSPETLISQFGSPSRVYIGWDEGPHDGSPIVAPTTSYDTNLHFDSKDLIVSYERGSSVQSNDTFIKACPLFDQFEFIRIWLGENPEAPPPDNIPINKASILDIEEFSKLMLQDSVAACFDIKKEIIQ